MRAREWTGRRSTPYLILAILTIGSANLAPAQQPDSTEFFESKIRPLFAAKCQECHGPKQQLGQLDLSRPAGLQRNTSASTPATEPVLVPGDPNASLLIRAVRYQSDIKMPPTGRLSESEIADLTRWVELGAPWPQETKAGKINTRAPGQPITDEERAFWAFQPVTHPAPPKVRNESWLRTPVDRFILARLESQGDTPAPPVDKLTLLRRVTYDLTGLPPTEREIGEFLEDSSSGAYRKVVERLLASSRYGERWGRHWLDVARYADSTGVDEDHKYPYAWKYRDYVIDAFNEDLPYDRFLQEQVAGDLMPTQGAGEVNARGIIATGFLALGRAKLIAEQDKKKMFYDIVDEQIEVVGKSILELNELNSTLPPKPPMANAVAEDKPIEQHVFISGNVRRLGDLAPKGFPVVLAGDDQPAITQGSGRVELARWLSSPNNPLTARVMVNRIWQWHLVEGLVRTPNNFGKLGERPTHAALLDYLATEFVRSGWSIKAMHRLILFSSTYSMRAEGDAGNYRSDPENRLWSHFNRRRMDAEEIRDSLLAIEGTIDFGMGGTLQTGTGMGMTTTSQIPPFDVSTSFRRTVYLPLRRSNIAKMLTLFDFGDAVTSTGRRARTNVAPQALFMMNSKFVSRVAKGLTRRVLAERGRPDEQRVRSAWLTILAKEPSQIEIGEALVYIREFQEGAAEKDFTEIEGSRQEEGHHLSADQPAYYYGPSTLAAWQSYCKILVASNDFIYIQ